MNRKLVAVAVSGGVDSSVAALLLQQQGYEVIGLHMHLFPVSCDDSVKSGKIKPDYLKDKAAQVCSYLGIPLHVIDLEKEFERYVIDYFCQGYLQGRTPNPCIICNRHIKFGLLLEKALSLNAEYLATGHYARIENREGKYHLLKGIDSSKDQSYVLYNLKQDVLPHILFPLGEYRKSDVRKIARENKLPVSEEPSSQDICFVSGKYQDFLNGRVESLKPGEIVTVDGKVLGIHQGIMHYTIGQRQGLGISAQSRLFVTRLDSERNRVIVGTEQELYSSELVAGNLNWLQEAPAGKPIDIAAKIRYKSPEVQARLFPGVDKVKIQFLEPQRAVTPGQSIVFYRNDEVIGGGIIEKEQ